MALARQLSAAALPSMAWVPPTNQARLCRLVPEQEYRAFAGPWEGAKAAMQDRAACMDAVAETLEAGLTLLGATAIEDQLQQVL